jgi:hypothetical protein
MGFPVSSWVSLFLYCFGFDFRESGSSWTKKEKKKIVPGNKMAEALFSLAKVMFDTGTIPENYLSSTVISLFKKGVATDVGNYRGISLIEILLKVVTAVATRRTVAALEKAEFFRQEQGGFRSEEECIAQVIALHEVCRRRREEGSNTYLFFADMRKAFDVVSHAAVLSKLKEAGVHGKMMDFFLGLYRNPRFQCRSGKDLSDGVKLSRGLRQGCNASPSLFLVFINDIMDAAERSGLGVDLPRLTQNDIDNGVVKKLVGLLFADDSVGAAQNYNDITRVVGFMEAWAGVFGMSFGLTKCAIMVVQGKGKPLETKRDIFLCGEAIPWESEYEYLGLWFNDDLDKSKMVKELAKKIGTKSLPAMRKMVGGACIPLALRLRAVKSLLIPALTYGGELFGLHGTASKSTAPALVRELESVLNSALFMISKGSWSASSRSLAAVNTLRRDWQIPSVEAVWAGKCARALVKFRFSKGWVAEVMKHAPPHKGATKGWQEAARLTCNKTAKLFGYEVGSDWTVEDMPVQQQFLDSFMGKSEKELGPVPANVRKALLGSHFLSGAPLPADGDLQAQVGIISRREGRCVQMVVEECRYRRTSTGTAYAASVCRYAKGGFESSRADVIKASLLHPELSSGFHWIARIRSGNFYLWKQAVDLAGRMEAVQLANNTVKEGCGCCGKDDVPDSLAHFFFDCKAAGLEELRVRMDFQELAQVLGERVGDYHSVCQNLDGKYLAGTKVTSWEVEVDKSSLALMLVGGTGYQHANSTTVFPYGLKHLSGWLHSNDKGQGPILVPASQHQTIAKAVQQMWGDTVRKGATVRSRRTKFQASECFLEAGLILAARFLQEAMKIRNAAMWQLNQKQNERSGRSQHPLVGQPSGT